MKNLKNCSCSQLNIFFQTYWTRLSIIVSRIKIKHISQIFFAWFPQNFQSNFIFNHFIEKTSLVNDEYYFSFDFYYIICIYSDFLKVFTNLFLSRKGIELESLNLSTIFKSLSVDNASKLYQKAEESSSGNIIAHHA